jgi:hypothetical protein
MYGTFLYAHWNIYEMYNFSMQWQIIFSNFLLFNLDVTCRYINKMLYSQLDILIDFCTCSNLFESGHHYMSIFVTKFLGQS